MYDFKKTEEDALKFWKDKKIYEKVKLKNKKGKKFYFLQGPPYTSGKLHIGHAWNNSMKDILLRFKRMNGLNVWDRAGYDMHGLPTENKVMKNLGLKDKDDIVSFGVEKFTKECTSFSVENAKAMDSDLQRLGIWLDYSDPYYPVRPVFIEGEWWMIKKAWEQKRLYKGKKIMHWCSECETSLAKHELEYENLKDKSIFLKFQIKDKKNEFLVVWTTTPWTIPFNLAIMVNPDFEYVKAKVGDETWIVAKALVQQVMDTIGKEFKIIGTISGKKMEGIKYIHPFYSELKEQFESIKGKNLHSVILSRQYVTTEAGSGLVHCAPGCGPEDFEVGKEYGLLPFNQINEQGIFVDMGKFTGMIAKKEDYKFIKALEEKGALIGSAKVEHEYATCWRCHNPVVFRAIEQWFLKIEDLIPEMLKSNEKVNWVPKWGKEAFDNWIGALKDNSITRQRFWGTPVPIWLCPNGHVEVVGSIDELKKKAMGKVPEDLHRPMIDSVLLKCPECKKEMKRIEDVIDVWIDAGTLSWNCLYYPSREDYFKNLFPADFILEATEQIKLWFSMLAICSEVAMRKPCYKSVYMHGMILDYQGMKMSKSLGNVISPYEVIDKCGADILRYYMCEVAAGENINFSWENVKQKQRNINVLWNVKNYLIEMASLLGKNPEKLKPKFGMEEKFILSRCNSTIKETTELFENYKLDETITKIENFFLELSRVYIQLVRDKVSLGSKEEKETVLYAIYNSFINILKMFAPVCPFITDSMYGELKEKFKLKEESIHLCEWPKANEKLIDKKLEDEFALAMQTIEKALAARSAAAIGVRWPLASLSIKADKKLSKELQEIVMRQVNVKKIIFTAGKEKEFEVLLDTKMNPELEAEGYSREVARAVQDARKKANLTKDQHISLVLVLPKQIEDAVKKHLAFLKEKTNAKEIEFKKSGKKYDYEASSKIKENEIQVAFMIL